MADRLAIGTRVRVVGSPEWMDKHILGALGTVLAHDDPYVVVQLDEHKAPHGDEGWLLLDDEVVAAEGSPATGKEAM